MARRSAKPKAVSYERIDPGDDPEGVHPLIRELAAAHHDHLSEARIGAAWRYRIKRDKDGLLVLGKCRKASDLDREFADLDFVVILNAEAWRHLTAAQRRALVDHELTHADVARDAAGEAKRDDRGRPVWRVRKHDLEEFRSVVERHGSYKADIEEFVRAAMSAGRPSLFNGEVA